ncbi:MAG: GDSL-type esterase/lipase family protein [Verrucomicrobiota bacterium]|nr:GDSL-type esterase/lipase family protein [Limisphaera sp.]MDW8382437.1 GDSL-type esterase/lipase family protein [Verrucomicrobiota bacterium]
MSLGFSRILTLWLVLGCLLSCCLPVRGASPDDPTTNRIDPVVLERVFQEVKTPFKYGIVLRPPPGLKIDCPNVFRFGGRWYMVYVQFENDPQGYTTQLAVSDDLLQWQPLGTILERGSPGSWDAANAAGGLALVDPEWGGSHALFSYENRYWMSYLGGPNPGYETPPLMIGLAHTDHPARPGLWSKLPSPILRPDDPDSRPFENGVLFKSHIFRDETGALGAPFVMFYNARPPRGDESIGIAVSDDLRTWRRYGSEPVIAAERPKGLKHGVICGDPQIVRMHGYWVMFYFGAFWKPGAFNTFAVSRDLKHWTAWTGPDLVAPSEPWDREFAHKPWVLKYEGVVYHFYCAVGDQGRVIALATSRDLRAEQRPPAPPPLPTLWLIGDSTVQTTTAGQMGWGTPLPRFFDTNAVRIVNRARGGRSSRTFFTEGLWDKVRAELRPGDFVLIQFGHNDGGPLDQGRARASLRGTGAETLCITNRTTGWKETVYTYGHYLRRYIREAREHGATPIILSPVPRNRWQENRVIRNHADYAGWAATVAHEEKVPFIDLNERVARHYESLGREKVTSRYFNAGDETHTTAEGAEVTARIVAQALAAFTDLPISRWVRTVSEPAAWERQ